MSLTEQFIGKAKQTPRRVVLPEGADERVVQAACRLAAEGIARPILLGADIPSPADGRSLEGVGVVDPKTSPDFERYCETYAGRREGIGTSTARRLIKRPLLFGAMMVSEGDADAMVAGVSRPTAEPRRSSP